MPAAKRKRDPAGEGTAASAQSDVKITRSTVPATIVRAADAPAGHVHDETAGGDGKPAGTTGG